MSVEAVAAASETPIIKELRLDEIIVDRSLQTRDGGTCDDTVEDYADAYRRGDDLPKPVVFNGPDTHGYLLAAGFHRREARGRAGFTTLVCEVRQGSRADAIF